MTENILICSIFRNRENHIQRWFLQIKNLVNTFVDYNFSISVYENDSTDSTRQKLKILFDSDEVEIFDNSYFNYDDLKTNYFNSIKSEQRVKNLAAARNKCLDVNSINLEKFTKILFIEPDFSYSQQDAIKILNAEQSQGIKLDIISGLSYLNGNFYDSWATRKTDAQTESFTSYKEIVEEYWTTFNGFCLYNSKPFIEGIRFNWFNNRLKIYDCDTAVICEDFREKGYNKIFIDRSARFEHHQ
jgi:hypothetical protein